MASSPRVSFFLNRTPAALRADQRETQRSYFPISRGMASRWAIRAWLGSLVLGGSLLGAPAWALSGRDATEQAEKTLQEVQAAAPRVQTKVARPALHKPEALIAQAEVNLRVGQYEEAIRSLSRIVELGRQGKTTENILADAQFLLAEAYFANSELYSARREYAVITERAEQPAYALLAGRAASRLVDVALRLERRETLPAILTRVEELSQRDTGEALRYARAKALLALERPEEARRVADSISSSALYKQRVHYLRGVALMKEAESAVPEDKRGYEAPDYDAAVAEFERATQEGAGQGDSADRSEARKISDQAWLAIARLHFEKARYGSAASAYEKIARTSDQFALALFELSWTYVRMGDHERAQRSLEALRVLDPGLIDGADAALLRADLHLRAGRFNDAEQAYEEVRNRYEPLRIQVDEFLAEHEDPATYYDKLTASEIESETELDPLILGWTREEAREDRIFHIVDDVARSRSLMKDARRRALLLSASLASDARAKAFPELRRELEMTVSLLNQVSGARLKLAQAMDEESRDPSSGELFQIRTERRQLMERLAQLPASPAEWNTREVQAERAWNEVGQELQRLQIESDHLHALVNGLRRVLREAPRHGIQADAAALARYQAEVESVEKEMESYRGRIADLRQQLEIGRVQTGFGDERFVEDERVRQAFREAFSEETSLVAGGADSKGQSYARSIQPLLERLLSTENGLLEKKKLLEGEVNTRREELEAAIRVETQLLDELAVRLDEMDSSSRVLVGEVARDNFVRVRARLKDVVLRADVGTTQKAWEVRENQRYRVLDLLRERASEERIINDELREVLDDAEEDSL